MDSFKLIPKSHFFNSNLKNRMNIMKFLRTIKTDELKDLLDSIPKLIVDEEILPLEQCFKRVISRDIKSNINVPHFQKSRMDGYAVKAEDTFGAEEDNLISLKMIESIKAGDKSQKKVNKGECSYVATGAPIPEGADGIVMVEFTEKLGNEILISQAISPGTHVVKIGHDVKKGEIICKKNRIVDLPTLGILSSCGISQINVYRKPLISLISTGNELVTFGSKELDVGRIYDVNSLKN